MVNRKTRQKKKLRKQLQRQREKERERDHMKTMSDFPFLDHKNTVQHISRSRVMFMMRGLPGSGKSTIVNSIKAKYKHATVCSADDYFLEEGEYRFDQNKLSEAHDYCQKTAQQACEEGRNVIVIDNTNVRRWEMKFYINLASRYNYAVVPVLPKTEWRFDPVELAKRNKHGVTAEILEVKVRKFEDGVPTYYGWILNMHDSEKVMNIGMKWLEICCDILADFKKFLPGSNEAADGTDAEQNDIRTLYSRGQRTNTPLHCTTCFCGRQRATPEALCYHSDPVVQKSVGQVFGLIIIGFVITPRTIGARIKLNQRQLQLWGNERKDNQCCKSSLQENVDENNEKYPLEPSSDCEKLARGVSNIKLFDKTTGDIKIKQSASSSKMNFHPTCGVGGRAHLTLGFSQGHQAVQTGLDLLDVICSEKKHLNDDRHIVTPGGVIRNYGEGRCVVYLNEPVKTKAIFTGCY